MSMSILLSCRRSSKQAEDIPKNIVNTELIGTWYLNKWDLYHTLYIQDTTHIVIDNHIDTLFYYTYDIKGDTLNLYQKYEELVNHNRILKLTKDSLVFENFLDKADVQRYGKKTISK
jgi:hypothetical protein